MIRVENLTKQFGELRAVNGLSFEMFPGEILGFLGPNGAGKTTTMRILTCFFPPTSGVANVAGFDVVREPDEVRRVIGYMPEGVPLYRDMTVSDFLDFIAHSKGYGSRERKKFLSSAIEETNLGDVQNRILGQLSKGYRQRVGLAQAIIGDPRVLILDEPTSGLDPRQIADMRQLIKSMAGRRTVILSTHILPEVQMTCSRVIIINKGKIAASGTPDKLTTKVQTIFQVEAAIIGPPESVLKALKDLPGVKKAELQQSGDGAGKEVRGLDGRAMIYNVSSGIESPDVRPAIVGMAVKNGWTLIELRELGLSLEDVFLRVVAGDTAANAPAPGNATAPQKPATEPAVAAPAPVAKTAEPTATPGADVTSTELPAEEADK